MNAHQYDDTVQSNDPHSPQRGRRLRPALLCEPYGVLRGNRPLSHVLAGQSLSSFADWLLAVVLSVVVRDISQSNMAVALLTVARLAPYALVLPVSGLMLDRGDRRLLTAGIGFGRAVCMLGILVAISTTAMLPFVFLLVFVSSSFSCLLRPTINTTIPDLVEEGDAVAGNGLVTQMDGIAHIVGPLLAAGFLALHTPSLAIVIAAGTFALSGMAFLTAPGTLRQVDSPCLLDLSHREAMTGFRYLLRENQGMLVALAVIASGLALLEGAYYVLAVALCKGPFHLGGQGVGWLDMVFGIGGLAGSLAVGAIARGSRTVPAFVAGAALTTVGVLVLSVSPSGACPFLCLAVLGIADVMARVTATTILQTAAPRDMLGRIFTAFEAILVGSILVGAVAAGQLVNLAGPRAATALLGTTSGILLLLALPRLRPLEATLSVRTFLRSMPLLAAHSD